VGPRPSSRHSLDRIDVNGHYEPGNVRWASLEQQNRNRRSNRFVEFRGERLCVKEWANRLGVSGECIRVRLNKGWPIEKALTTPSARVRSRQ
jgi:hypothetical protein